jgi:hypothetical protein
MKYFVKYHCKWVCYKDNKEKAIAFCNKLYSLGIYSEVYAEGWRLIYKH